MTITREKLARVIAASFHEATRPYAPYDPVVGMYAIEAIEAAGLRIVPADPTHQMLAHAWKAFRGNRQNQLVGPGPGFSEAIRAMIAASPIAGGKEGG